MSKQYANCMVQIAIYLVCDNIYFCVLQLAGTAVLAIGLWLRLDQKTKSLFEEPDSSYVFYTGKMQGCLLYHSYLYKSYLFFSVYHMCCVCRCIYSDSSWSTDHGGGLSGMLWCHPGVPLYAGNGLYHLIIFITIIFY